jgi:hypothetical protein
MYKRMPGLDEAVLKVDGRLGVPSARVKMPKIRAKDGCPLASTTVDKKVLTNISRLTICDLTQPMDQYVCPPLQMGDAQMTLQLLHLKWIC